MAFTPASVRSTTLHLRRLAVFAGAVVGVGLLVGCAGSDASNAAISDPLPAVIEAEPAERTVDADALRIGLSTQNLERSFFVGLVAGAEERADELGIELVVVDGLDDVGTQHNGVDELLASGVDVLILSPIDSIEAESMVERASAAGVPVVAVANQVGSAEQYGPQFVHPDIVSLVTNDDVDMGRKAGLFVASLAGADVIDIAVLAGKTGTANAVLRLEGFEQELAALGVDHRIVSMIDGSWNADGGAAACAEFAAEEDLDMVFSMSDAMTAGCVEVFDQLGFEVPIVSIGGNAAGIELLTDGRIVGSVCQKPGTMGALAVDSAVAAAIDGETNQGLRFYETPVVTADRLDDCQPQW